MKKTIRQLRQESGESETQLAEALDARLQDIRDLETCIASPSVERLPNGHARAPGRLRSSHPERPARRSGRQKFVKNGPDDVAGQGATRVKARSSRARRSARRGWSISSRARPEGGNRPICTAGVEEGPGRDLGPDCGRGVAQNDQRGVMGDEGGGEVGWIDGNDVRPRPQQGEGGGDGVTVGVRLDGN